MQWVIGLAIAWFVINEAATLALFMRGWKRVDAPYKGIYFFEAPLHGPACAIRFLWFNFVFLDREKMNLFSEKEQHAILAHEVGHVRLGHTRYRFWVVVTGIFLLGSVRRILAEHEWEADDYASSIVGHDAVRSMRKRLEALCTR